MKNYDRIIAIAEKQIEKFGGTVYLHVPVDGKVNSGTGQTTYSQLTIPTKAIVIGYSKQEVNDISVLESDRKVLIRSEDGKPLVNNTITINGELFRILVVNEINPGVNKPIVYQLHVRNTTLAPDLDGFVTTLKGLEVGDVVVDPNAVRDYPKWVKVADGHHAPTITTLVEQRPYYAQAWSATPPGLNRWANSDLYTWLNTVYLSKLSIEFNEILRQVLIETQGYFTYDKISLLSKEELDGVYVGSSSGKQIPYFNTAIRRIAVAEDTLENVDYWTRSYVPAGYKAGKVDDLGNINSIGYPIANIYGVRAMVFLQDSQLVKLNDDGTYKLLY